MWTVNVTAVGSLFQSFLTADRRRGVGFLKDRH
jgi:hypothetical protein